MYIYTRDAGLEVELEGEGVGDFRMPGLVRGTVVPGSLPYGFSRRVYMYLSKGRRPDRVCTHT